MNIDTVDFCNKKAKPSCFVVEALANGRHGFVFLESGLEVLRLSLLQVFYFGCAGLLVWSVPVQETGVPPVSRPRPCLLTYPHVIL